MVLKWFLKRRERGQNLVEFAMTAPIFFVLIFGVIEFSRALHAYNACRLAASSGAFAASSGNSTGPGFAAMQARLGAAKLAYNGGSVAMYENGRVYAATANTTFVSMFPGVTIPLFNGTSAQLIPSNVPITASESSYTSIY